MAGCSCPEARQRHGKAAPDGASRHFQPRRYLAVRIALQVGQSEDLPVLGTHLAKRVLDGMSLNSRHEPAPNTRDGRRRHMLRDDEPPRSAMTAQPRTRMGATDSAPVA